MYWEGGSQLLILIYAPRLTPNHSTPKHQAYFADDDEATGEHRAPVLSEELGLAIETLRPGASLRKLWSVT
jgi:hypothetical protein